MASSYDYGTQNSLLFSSNGLETIFYWDMYNLDILNVENDIIGWSQVDIDVTMFLIFLIQGIIIEGERKGNKLVQNKLQRALFKKKNSK